MNVILTCTNCDEEFVFTEGEQRFYLMKGFNIPKRCKTCRGKVSMRDAKVRTSNYFENAQIFGPGWSVYNN